MTVFKRVILTILFFVNTIHSLDSDVKDRIYGHLDSVIRSDRFTMEVASVDLQNHLYGAQRVELEKARNDPDVAQCVVASLKESIDDSQALVNSTFGSIMGDLIALRGLLDGEPTEEDYVRVVLFLDQLDYTKWRKVMIKRFKRRMDQWVPEQRAKMDKCVPKWN